MRGVFLFHAHLMRAARARYPDAWERRETWRAVVKDGLGIDLHEDVLPLSNLLGYIAPFLLRPDRAIVR